MATWRVEVIMGQMTRERSPGDLDHSVPWLMTWWVDQHYPVHLKGSTGLLGKWLVTAFWLFHDRALFPLNWRWSHEGGDTAMCRQTAVAAYFKSKQLLLFVFAPSEDIGFNSTWRPISLSRSDYFKGCVGEDFPANTEHLQIVQRRPNVSDVGPASYKYYTNVLCLLGCGF